MKTVSLLEKTAIEPENIVGTKWISSSNSIGDRMTIEFVDKKNCVYTLKPNKYPMTYTVIRGRLYITNVKCPFELRGNELFGYDFPTFKKVA